MAGEGLGDLVSGSALGDAATRVVTAPVVCRWCGSTRFEVVSDECFCEGCCLPLGLAHGEFFPGGGAWRLVLDVSALPGAKAGVLSGADLSCQAEHGVFEVAVAYALESNGRICRLSVGLRCPVDGALHLYLDDVRAVRRET